MSDAMLNNHKNWQQLNYQHLLAEIDKLKQLLYRRLSVNEQKDSAVNDTTISVFQPNKPADCSAAITNELAKYASMTNGVDQNTENMPKLNDSSHSSVMLSNLCRAFGLSYFERQLLLLCIAVELDAEVPGLYMKLVQHPAASMALALMLFEGHCAVLAAEAPLRFFQLIDVKQDNHCFIRRTITISDWTLFYLTGKPILDASLSDSLYPVKLNEPVLPTREKVAETLNQLKQAVHNTPVVVQLLSQIADDARQIVAIIGQQQGKEVYEFNLHQLPMRSDEQKTIRQRIERELIARQCLLLIDCQRMISGNEPPADRHLLCNWLDCLIRDVPQACLLYAPQRLELPQTLLHYQQLPALSVEEQHKLLQHCLQESHNQDTQPLLSTLTSQYHLNERQLRSVAHSAAIDYSHSQHMEDNTEVFREKLWQHSREQLRQNLKGMAKVIPPADLNWNDVILADKEQKILQSIVSQVEQRQQVYHQWGFSKQVPYGLGICALFAGGSGTGKTLVARVIASLLRLDLYHVDLSSVVDKYIGETEKKLDKIFTAAQNSGAILLFDEADALFGKRTKVQESRDRYANMGVSFLLQRIESYSGLSILTTNLRSAIDVAFTRRLRFIVQFPFPSDKERKKIWHCMMPDNAPTDNIDYQKLSRLALSGGMIRNIALQGAFMAAAAGQSITMQHLLEAVRQEYVKAEKTLDENLVIDW